MTDDLLTLARDTALAAGELVKRRREEGVTVADLKSSPVDVVTNADRESEALIRSILARARPTDGFFGEEGAAGIAEQDAGTSGLTWIVDPIDGTVNYLYDIPQYTASVGDGAFLGDRRLQVAPSVELSQALVGTGFSYSSETRAHQGRVVAQLLPEVRDIRRMGAASLDLCAVATGRLNAYYERGLSPWDHAAAGLIAREAGALVVGENDAPPSKEFILAAEESVARALQSRLLHFGV
jgi:myo-inositol-1(or 4)-monophosphatase